MSKQYKRWLKRAGWALLVIICILPCIIYIVSQLPFVQQYYANRLDYVLGEVEPVLLAGDGAVADDLSPDGRWFYIDISILDQDTKPGMMDMETYQIYTLDASLGGGPAWVDNHHYKTGSTLIRVPDMMIWYLKPYLEPNENALAALDKVNHIFVIEELIPNGYVLVSTDPQVPYVVQAHWNKEELVAKLAKIPHTIVPKKVWVPNLMLENERVYSPDGKYFVSGVSIEYSPGDKIFYPHGFRQPLAIFEAGTEKGVALAQKNGWDAILLGWASDSSGVYLQFRPSGAGYGPLPAGLPTYKLLVPGQKPRGKKPIFVEGKPPGN